MTITEPFLPFPFAIEVSIHDRNWDFLLTVDETGQVFEASPAVFELPKITQKLSIGETEDQLERKLWAYAKLLKYLLPLALAGKLPSYAQQLAPLLEEIKRRLQERGLLWRQIPLETIPYSFAKQVLEAFDVNAEESSNLKELWEKVVFIIENPNSWPINEIRFLGYNHPGFSTGFFPAITPFYDANFQPAFFENLQTAKSASVKRYLLEELARPSCLPYSSGILFALSDYTDGDKDIHDGILQFYAQSSNLDDYHFEKIMDILKQYPSSRTKEIGLEILRANKRRSALHVTKILIDIGVPQGEIVAIMMPLFKSADPQISEAAYHIFGECISKDFLPSATETLDLYVSALSKQQESYITNYVSGIAYKTGIHLLTNRLYDLLQHEIPSVREGILGLIIGLYHRKQVSFAAFMSPQMVDRYWDLTNDLNSKVVIMAIRMISIIGFEQKKKNYIDLLLEIARKTQDEHIRSAAIRSINDILEAIPYQYQIESFYLEVLEDTDYYSRYETLYGLRFSPDRAFKRFLREKYKDDSFDLVRMGAVNLFRVPFRGMNIYMQETFERLKRLFTPKVY